MNSLNLFTEHGATKMTDFCITRSTDLSSVYLQLNDKNRIPRIIRVFLKMDIKNLNTSQIRMHWIDGEKNVTRTSKDVLVPNRPPQVFMGHMQHDTRQTDMGVNIGNLLNFKSRAAFYIMRKYLIFLLDSCQISKLDI